MLNRRILRIKVFKVLYSYAENRSLTLEEAMASLEASCEATRDLYLLLLSIAGPLTAQARRLVDAAMGKFNPTEADLNPSMNFVNNGLAPLLSEDPDFTKLISKRHLEWDQEDSLIRNLYNSIEGKDWFKAYQALPARSLKDDAALFRHIFTEEFEDNPAVEAVLEERSLYWKDELAYALNCVLHSLDDIARTGRWTLPPLYNSDMLVERGVADADSDRDFSRRLLTAAFGRYEEYSAKVAESVTRFDRDRLFTTDIVLIALGLAEAEHFPEIPVKATINEYVEIAKYYSTPKSAGFVNGLLDRLIRESMEAGKIQKKGLN